MTTVTPPTTDNEPATKAGKELADAYVIKPIWAKHPLPWGDRVELILAIEQEVAERASGGLDVERLARALDASPTFRLIRHGRVLSPKDDAEGVAREVSARLASPEGDAA